MNDQQTGWEQYKQIKTENDKDKNAERLELQKRHDNERAKLAEKLKAERSALLSGDWKGKGKGEARNLLQSTTAALQAAEKLELQERQRAERKAFLAKYKPLPMYKIWKEQPFIVAAVDALHIEPRETQISVSRTLRALTSKVDQYNNVTYQLERKDVFRDEGRIIQILDLNSDAGIAAALAVAQQKFGNVLTLTGSPAFQQNAVAVAVNNGLTCRFSDPALDKLRDELQQQKYQAERDAARAERDRAAAAQLEKSKEPEEVPLPPAPVPSPIQAEKAAQAEAAEVQKRLDDEKAAEDHRLSETVQLADVHRQIAETKAEADPRNLIHSKPVVHATEEDYTKPASGAIIGSNETFVVAAIGKEIKIYRVAELEKQPVKYDGIDDKGRFAKGNTIDIKSSKTVSITERRKEMQTEATRNRQRGTSIRG